MGFKGDLTSISLADVFQTLAMSQKEGTLVLTEADRSRTIFFGKGAISLVGRTPPKRDCLANLLLHAGSVNSEQIAAALENGKATRRTLSDVLMDMGLATQDEIDLVMRSFLEEELYDIFWWKTAHFEFFDGPLPEHEVGEGARQRAQQFDINGLLFEAARRLDEWDRMLQVVPDFSAVYLLSVDGQTVLESGQVGDPNEAAVLRLCDGTRNVNQLIKDVPVSRFDAVRLLSEATAAGKVLKAEVEHLRDAAIRLRDEGDRERALAILSGALAMAPDDLPMLEMTAQIQDELGRKAEAAGTYLRLATQAKLESDAARATQALERAVLCDPVNLEAQLALCRHHADGGNKERAEELAKPLAVKLVASKRSEEARDLCVWAAGFAREPLDLHVVQARALLELKNREGARQILEKAVHALSGKEARRYEQLTRRVQALAGETPDLLSLAQGMSLKRVKSGKTLKFALVGAVVLAVLVGAGWWYKQQEAKASAAFERAREEAERLASGKQWDAARDALRKIGAQFPLSSVPARVTTAVADIDRRQREEAERAAREQAALIDAHKRAAQERRERLEQAAELENIAPNLAQSLQVYAEVEEWATANSQPDIEKVARTGRERVQARIDAAATLAREVEGLIAKGEIAQANAKVKLLWEKHDRTPAARESALPIQVRTVPPGASIKAGRMDVGKSPVVVSLPRDAERLSLLIEYPGFLPNTREVSLQSEAQVSVTLEKIIRWRYRTRGPIEGRPTLHEGRVYFGSRDGHLYAVNLSDGSLAWAFRTADGGDILSSPFVHGDSVYAGSNDQKVYRIARDTGKEKWRYAAGLFVQGDPLVLDDLPLVVVGSHDKKLHGIHRDTGKALWTVPTGGPITGQAAVWGNSVLFGSEDGILRAVEPAGGKVLWTIACGSDIVATPVVAGDQAYVGTKAGTLICLDLPSRKTSWTLQMGASITRRVALGADAVYAGSSAGWVFAVSRTEGKELWRVNLGAAISGGLALYEDQLVVGARDGNVHVLHSSDGSTLWKLGTRGPVNGIPTVQDGMLYVGSDDGHLYATDVPSSAR